MAQDPGDGPQGPPPSLQGQPGDQGYQGDQGDQPDPPSRVARLNYLQGAISFQAAGTQDWVDAAPNRPLTTGDSLWVDQNARGEMHINSTSVHVGSQTGVSFLNLNDQIAQIQLAEGTLDMRVRALNDNEAYEIDTPNMAFTVVRPGEFRINVDPNGGVTTVDVISGSGEGSGGGQAYPLNPGQEYSFAGADQLSFNAQPLPPRDDFSNWCASRYQREDASPSARYVSRDVIGYDDLDEYGKWSQDSDYGPVWIPSGVAADWAPYHNGHWVFIAPWGWTWVEDEPWGFAPFHYGRWAMVGGVWGWVPGPVAVGVVVGGPVVRPMYAPALVGFVGGGGLSVSVAFGGVAGVGWFPLGPRDVWVPAYRCSPVYVQRVNVVNTRVVNVTQVTTVYNNSRRNVVVNNYTYANNTRAVTAVSRETFVNGQAVGRSSIRVTSDQIGRPQVIRTGAPLAPTRQSFVGTARVSNRMPPAMLANRRVVTKATPAANAVPIGHTAPLARGNNGGGFNRGNFDNGGNNGNNAGRPAGNPGNPNGGFRGNNNPATNPNDARGNGNAPGGFQRPNNSNNPGNTTNTPNNNGGNNGGNNNGSNGGRPGFRPFQPPPSRGNAQGGNPSNGNPNPQGGNANGGNNGNDRGFSRSDRQGGSNGANPTPPQGGDVNGGAGRNTDRGGNNRGGGSPNGGNPNANPPSNPNTNNSRPPSGFQPPNSNVRQNPNINGNGNASPSGGNEDRRGNNGGFRPNNGNSGGNNGGGNGGGDHPPQHQSNPKPPKEEHHDKDNK